MPIKVREHCRAAAKRHAEKRAARKHHVNESAKARYHTLRAHGLCVRCKRESTRSLCDDCRLWHNQYRSGASGVPRSPYKDGRRS